MLTQIAIGTVLLIVNITLAAIAAMALEVLFQKTHPWLMREPHRPKLVLLVAGVSLWLLGVITLGVWIWAVAYYWLGAFPTLEQSVYFSIVAYTTLGLGDVVLPQAWRILSRRIPLLGPAAVLLHIPGTLPAWNWLYQVIARNRYRFAGRCDDGSCRLP